MAGCRWARLDAAGCGSLDTQDKSHRGTGATGGSGVNCVEVLYLWGPQVHRSGRVTLVIGLIDLKQWPGWLAHESANPPA